VSARHPIPERIACQAKICHFHRRFKLAQRTVRDGVIKFLGYKVELKSQKREVFETTFMLRWEWYAFCTGLEVIHILSKCYPLPKPYTTDV
jgi:hypothetical protein